MTFKWRYLPIFLLLIHSLSYADKVHWHPWDKSTFDKANKENKLILINVGMEGCAACARMDKFTYDDQRVVN